MKILKKTISLILAISLSLSLFSLTAFAEEENDESYNIYVITDQNGKVNKTIFDDEINTESNKNIILPIDVSVKYFLNDQEISRDKIKNQSGKVKIRFDFKSSTEDTIPFGASAVVMLEDKYFSNIEVSDGKVLSDGKHSIVTGIATPGVNYYLNFNEDDIKLYDYIEVTADTTNCDISCIYVALSSSIFSNIDLSKHLSDDERDLLDNTEDLTDAMVDLKDGCMDIYDGLERLQDGARTINTGINTLDNALQQLSAADFSALISTLYTLGQATAAQNLTVYVGTVNALANSVHTTLKPGMSSLVAGFNKLDSGVLDFYDGLEELDDEAITKITDLLGGDKDGIINRVDNLREASDNFAPYCKTDGSACKNIKYIYKISE